MSYKHILVAVDLSESSEKVIERAAILAKDVNAKLSLIFVDVDNINIAMTNIEISVLPSVEEREIKLQHELQALADKSHYPIENILVVAGKLVTKLSAIIEEKGIDLLVCGHHHDLLSRLLSSINHVVNSAVTDLLVVYHKD